MAMQQYSIGRGDDCRIRIADNSQRVSRNHATLKVMDNGKIFITDHSSNGTYVNGIKISTNVDFPIKRGDSVSFANVSELNWEVIPKRTNKAILYSIIAVAIIAIGIIAWTMFVNPNPVPPTPTNQQVTDTTGTYQREIDLKKQEEAEKQKQDSIKKVEDEKIRQETDKKSKKPKTEANKPKQENNQSKPDSTNTSKKAPKKQAF